MRVTCSLYQPPSQTIAGGPLKQFVASEGHAIKINVRIFRVLKCLDVLVAPGKMAGREFLGLAEETTNVSCEERTAGLHVWSAKRKDFWGPTVFRADSRSRPSPASGSAEGPATTISVTSDHLPPADRCTALATRSNPRRPSRGFPGRRLDRQGMKPAGKIRGQGAPGQADNKVGGAKKRRRRAVVGFRSPIGRIEVENSVCRANRYIADERRNPPHGQAFDHDAGKPLVDLDGAAARAWQFRSARAIGLDAPIAWRPRHVTGRNAKAFTAQIEGAM